MAIGLGTMRAVGHGRRAGRAGDEHERSTVREVCLIGLDRRTSAEDWTAGQEVIWLGRGYRVVATTPVRSACAPAGEADADIGAGPSRATARHYVHLAPGGAGGTARATEPEG
jgi:hypothetical protein